MSKNNYKFNKVYSFSTENLNSYQELFNFNNARILSFLGDGDNYFSSLLNGAKEITLFDDNITAMYYFYLKFYSIRELTYQDFIGFFIKSNFNCIENYFKVRKCLPINIKIFLDRYKPNNFSNLLIPSSSISTNSDLISGRVIPYFKKENYYKLQNILRDIPFPYINLVPFNKIQKILDQEVDIIMLSNLYMFLKLSPLEFREKLESLKMCLSNKGIIEANYIWSSKVDDFTNLGFTSREVEASNYDRYIEGKKDNVLILK